MSIRFYDSMYKKLTREQVPGPTAEGSPSNIERYMTNMEPPKTVQQSTFKTTVPKLSDYGKKSE